MQPTTPQQGFSQDEAGFVQTTPTNQYYRPQPGNNSNLNYQNNLVYASFWERIGGYFVDFLVISVISSILSFVVAIPFLPSMINSFSELETTLERLEKSSDRRNSNNNLINNRPSSNTITVSGKELNLTPEEEKIAQEAFFSFFRSIIFLLIMVHITSLVFTWLYYSIMESSEYQGTVGKLVLGLKVTDLNGNKISFARATGRNFAKIITGFTFGIGHLMVLFTEKRQTLHDMIASCVVVKK